MYMYIYIYITEYGYIFLIDKLIMVHCTETTIFLYHVHINHIDKMNQIDNHGSN